jgi:hypothetical protein
VFLTHKTTPNSIAIRAKYDTGCDVNFIPKSFVEDHGLTKFMTLLGGEDARSEGQVLVGLNNQEHVIYHDTTLRWCADNMHQVRTTKFHVADSLPYEMVLGDPFILENRYSIQSQRLCRWGGRDIGASVSHERICSGNIPKVDNIDADKPEADKQEEEERASIRIRSEEDGRQRIKLEDAEKRARARQARLMARSQISTPSMTLPLSNVGSLVLPPSSIDSQSLNASPTAQDNSGNIGTRSGSASPATFDDLYKDTRSSTISGDVW